MKMMMRVINDGIINSDEIMDVVKAVITAFVSILSH